MSIVDYADTRRIRRLVGDPSFGTLVMLAALKADTGNLERLRSQWPEIVAELEARYNAPGGVLGGDPPSAIAYARRIIEGAQP